MLTKINKNIITRGKTRKKEVFIQHICFNECYVMVFHRLNVKRKKGAARDEKRGERNDGQSC